MVHTIFCVIKPKLIHIMEHSIETRFPKYVIMKNKDKMYHKKIFQKTLNENMNKMEEKSQMSIAHLEESRTSSKDLSEKYESRITEIHALKSREALHGEEVEALEYAIKDLIQEKARVTEHTQHLLQKKKDAELGKGEADNEMKKKHEAILKAIAYYKQKLYIRMRFDEDKNILLHFLNILYKKKNMCCVRMSHSNGKWKLLGTEPVLPCEQELAARLEETQDIQGFVPHVRKLFIQLCAEGKDDAKVA